MAVCGRDCVIRSNHTLIFCVLPLAKISKKGDSGEGREPLRRRIRSQRSTKQVQLLFQLCSGRKACRHLLACRRKSSVPATHDRPGSTADLPTCLSTLQRCPTAAPVHILIYGVDCRNLSFRCHRDISPRKVRSDGIFSK